MRKRPGHFFKTLRFVSALILFAVTVVLGAQDSCPSPRAPHQRSENFDRDPHWDAQNNRMRVEPNPVIQDFGFANSRRAQGQAAGEIGGRIQRCTTPAYYGKPIEPRKTLDDELHCSGQFVIGQTMGMSSLYFGWFNSQTMETRPRNFMGMMINGEGKGCEVHVSYNTAGGQSDGIRTTGVGPKGAAVRDFNLIPVETVYTFDFHYDPAANDGNGEITFTLGGDGPFTGGPFHIKISPEQRRSGATFDAFGFVNPQSAGNWMTMYVDDLVIDGQVESFDDDPQWVAQGNRGQLDDYDVEGAHQFGFRNSDSEPAHAGGNPGEAGGLIYSSPSTPGYYAADVGELSLNDRLTARGRIALTKYGSDGAICFGWFRADKRGFPPANILGVLIDGPTSTPPRFQGWLASADPQIALCAREPAAFIPPDGTAHSWQIEYSPDANAGHGEIKVQLDEHSYTIPLPANIRERGATFDRFGIFVHEGGGRSSRVYLDDLEFTSRK